MKDESGRLNDLVIDRFKFLRNNGCTGDTAWIDLMRFYLHDIERFVHIFGINELQEREKL